jgi:biopolymer transport protein ExbB/TolQ
MNEQTASNTDQQTFGAQFFNSFGWDVEGSSYMWVILFMGALGLAIAIERVYYIVIRSNVNANKFMSEIRKLVASGNIKRAIDLCEKGKEKALPYVVLGGLKRAVESEVLDFRAIQNAVDESTLEVIPKLNARTNYLSMLANVSTLIGLMGTIYGLILAFAAVGGDMPESEKSKFLTKGISAAMMTTIMGLMVAIPLTMIFTYIQNKTTKIVDEMDEHLVKLINLITNNK